MVSGANRCKTAVNRCKTEDPFISVILLLSYQHLSSVSSFIIELPNLVLEYCLQAVTIIPAVQLKVNSSCGYQT